MRVSIVCVVCGKTFEKLQCQINKGRGICCSRSCTAYHSLARQGKIRFSKIEQKFFDDCERAGALIKRQVKIGPFCVDALDLNDRVAFEFDGTYWHSLARVKAADQKKEKYISSRGIRTVRIAESLYRTDPESAIACVTHESRKNGEAL